MVHLSQTKQTIQATKRHVTHLALVLVHTMYSTSSVYGLRNANADVRSHTHSLLLARNRYMTDITCPFSLSTASNNQHKIYIQFTGYPPITNPSLWSSWSIIKKSTTFMTKTIIFLDVMPCSLKYVCIRRFWAPWKYPYFDRVVGLVRSYDPESYDGSSLLLVGSPMPNRSKVTTQTKRDALALQVEGW